MGSYSFTVVIEPDGDQFHVYVPALPGCHSFGDNQDEALANIREAIELHVESMLEDGEEVPREPEPARVGRVTIPIHPAKNSAQSYFEGHPQRCRAFS
jgi:predicted RNase H-like HicB family nuclease